ncbi:MAG: DsbA family protein [Oscillospiraceae bacterium]|nr:DsbA family protein [Oscillospiraceae bacterium]
MRKMEMFFDYACPYCLTGHEYLLEELPKHTDIEVIWRPCEAHPRPEEYERYSDLCVEGLLYAIEKNVDIWEFHMRMYYAACRDGVDIENADALAAAFEGFLDSADMAEALKSRKYEKAVLEANDYAFEENDVWFIPAFRMDGKKLDAEGGVGITKEQLAKFMKG